MATHRNTASKTSSINDDATFRASIVAMRAALAAVGLVQTSDTGQIDPVTVAKPVGVSTSAGYEIWRFNDARQADFPVFIKVEYGTSSVNATSLAMWMTVGSATNGAGTINAQTSSRVNLASQNVDLKLLMACFIDGTFVLGLQQTASLGSSGMFIAVERAKDSNGVVLDEAVMFSGWGATTSGPVTQVIPKTGSVPSAASTGLACPIDAVGPGNIPAETPLSPWVMFNGRQRRSLLLSCSSTSTGDPHFGRSFVTVTYLGRPRTYYVWDGQVGAGWFATGAGGGNGGVVLMPWE